MAEAATDTADIQDIQLQQTSMQEPAASTARKRALSDPQDGLEARPPKMPTIYEEQDSQEDKAIANDDTNPASVPLHHSDAPKEVSTDAQTVLTRAEKQNESGIPNTLEQPQEALPNIHNIVPPTPSSAEQPTQPGVSGTASPAEIFGYVPSDLRQQRSTEESSVSHHPYFSPINTRKVGLGISGAPNLPSISASSASSSSNYNNHARSRSYAGFYDGFTLPATAASPAGTPPYSLYTSYGVQQPAPSTNSNLTESSANQGRFPFPAPNSYMDHRQITSSGSAANQIYTPQSWLPYPTSSSAASTTGSSSFSYIYGPTRQVHDQNISPERSYRNTPFPSPASNNNNNHTRRNSIIQMPQEQQMGSPASNHSPSRSRQVSDEDAQVLSRINALYEQYQKYGAGAEQRNLEDHERSFYKTVSDRSLQQAHELASLMSLSKSVFGDSDVGNTAASPARQHQQQQQFPPTNELASPDRNRASSFTSSSFLRCTPGSQYQASPQLASQQRSPQRRYTPEQLRSIYQQQTKEFADFYAGMTPTQLETYKNCSDSDKEKIARAIFRNIVPLDGGPSSDTTHAAGPASSSSISSASLNNPASQQTSSQTHPPLLPLSAQAGLRASSNDETAAKDATTSSAILTTTQHNAAVRAEHERAQTANKDITSPAETGNPNKVQPKTFNGRSISIRLGGVSTSTPAKVKPEPSDSNLESKVEDKSAVHEGDSINQETSVILNAHNDSGIALDESPVKTENGNKQSTRDRTKTFEGLAAIAGRFINDSPVKSSDIGASNEDDEDSRLPKTEPNDGNAQASTSAPQPFVFRGQRSKAFKKTASNDFEGPQMSRGDIVLDLDWDWNATVFQPLLIRFDDQTNPFQLSYNWSVSECAANRRLVQYSSTFNAEAREMLITGRVVQPESFYRVSEQDGAVVSCIFKSEIERVLNKARTNDDVEAIYWITAPDVIKLMEAIIGSTKHHCTDLRGRIRSKVNSTNNRSIQVSKSGATPIERDFAKQIMNYDNPKPRVQDRPLRVTPWLELPQLLQKIAERFWVVV